MTSRETTGRERKREKRERKEDVRSRAIEWWKRKGEGVREGERERRQPRNQAAVSRDGQATGDLE